MLHTSQEIFLRNHMQVRFRRRGLMLTSPPATEEIGAMGREIKSRQGVG
jgi:hypothetical protein